MYRYTLTPRFVYNTIVHIIRTYVFKYVNINIIDTIETIFLRLKSLEKIFLKSNINDK